MEEAKKMEEFIRESCSWAKYPVSDATLEKVMDICRDDEEHADEDVVLTVLNAIESDCDGKPAQLVGFYKDAPEQARMIIDAFCVNLCGWSFATLCNDFASDFE